MAVRVDDLRCAACGGCVGLCPSDALTLDEMHLRVAADACTECGLCVAACPMGALSLTSTPAISQRPLRAQYDVIVVGAGPAGSQAAEAAASAGASVLLLEKRQEIGSPVRCAEGVAREALEALVPLEMRWTAAVVERAEVTVETAGGLLRLEAGGGKGYILERRLFDAYLAERAVAAGADVRVKTAVIGLLWDGSRVAGVRVRMDGQEREIAASVVIGADGVESWVGRWAGLSGGLPAQDHMTCAQYLLAGIDTDARTIQYFISDRLAPGGYVWIFPKGERRANVGLGVQADLAVEPPLTLLNRFVESRPALAKGSPVTLISGAVPVASQPARLVSDGVMLVGDAARQVDPLTGGGIIMAMRAGRLAGRVAAEAARAGAPDRRRLSAYETEWQAGYGRMLARNYRLRQRFPPHQRANEDFLRLFAIAAAGA